MNKMKVSAKTARKAHFHLAVNKRGVLKSPAEAPYAGLEGAVVRAKTMTLEEALRQQRSFPHMEVRHRAGALVKPAAYY